MSHCKLFNKLRFTELKDEQFDRFFYWKSSVTNNKITGKCFVNFYIILALKIHKTRNNFLIITPEIYFQSLLSLFDIRNLSPKL